MGLYASGGFLPQKYGFKYPNFLYFATKMLGKVQFLQQKTKHIF